MRRQHGANLPIVEEHKSFERMAHDQQHFEAVGKAIGQKPDDPKAQMDKIGGHGTPPETQARRLPDNRAACRRAAKAANRDPDRGKQNRRRQSHPGRKRLTDRNDQKQAGDDEQDRGVEHGVEVDFITYGGWPYRQ